MVIPKYEEIMLPILKLAADKEEHFIRDAYDTLADYFKLNNQERYEPIQSGKQPIFENRVGWAKTYLTKAMLLESKKRSYFNITQRGLDVLSENPSEISADYLKKFPEFCAFLNKVKEDTKNEKKEMKSLTPLEKIDNNFQILKNNLSEELLIKIKESSPQFFENLVIDLLVNMGYGGSRKDAAKVIGKSGDGGIDGIIKEDRLGLDVIYIQAKKWEGNVSRPEIQKFVGALFGRKANKGVFITTSSFTKEAIDYASQVNSKIILINGEQLVDYMIENDLGVSKETVYEIKKIDFDYFSEE